MALRYVDLNRQINHDYGVFGQFFQSILDASFASTGESKVYPSWFAFAAFASRGIGQAELGADIALDTARFHQETGDHRAALARALPAHLVQPGAELIATFSQEDARLAAIFLVAFASAARHHGAFQGLAVSAMLDPRTLNISVNRLLELLLKAPGSNPLERLASVALTLRNTMADGNRSIYSDIGGMAQDYLAWCQGNTGGVTPDQVLNEFSLANRSRPDLAKAAYEFALQHLKDMPLPIHFDQLFPRLAGDGRPLVVAGFALYEKAGRTADLAAKNRHVAFANNYVIYREQHEAIQPAFSPGRVMPGEADRLKLLAIITPTIQVVLRLETWMFWQYADLHLAARDPDPLHSRATQYNWGVFEDRWAPVVDTFGPCYRNPAAMWPPPNPDPNQCRAAIRGAMPRPAHRGTVEDLPRQCGYRYRDKRIAWPRNWGGRDFWR
jgi:hypothetical protein